ncbi:MAG TPA: CHAT domain-containing protein [Bryobacteraceae bacterium]|nr:CHAT domain-containing protein [Bryobacteraceae bacterium]
MDQRFGVGKAPARQAWLRQVTSFCLIGFSLWFWASVSLMAQNSGEVRIAVAHQHVGSWCVGYLHIDGDDVWYEVVKPARYQDHAFRVQRSQITTLRQWVLLGQPQNATEMKYGNATYHFWLLADQDISHAPQVELQTPVTLPYQVLISLIARGGNRIAAANGARVAPATGPSAPSIPSADPDDLLKSALQTMADYRQHFYQTGTTSDLFPKITAARANAQTAYQQFMGRRDSAKAAQSLIAVTDIDRMLMVQNRPDYQASQESIKQKYNAALALADAANSEAMRFKAFIRLSLTDSNSKDYAAAFEHASKAIDLAMASDNKDDLLNAYENAAQVEIARGDLSAASDYLDRAMNVVGQAKDQHVIWLTYTDRADVYGNRADQCNYQHDYAVCKQAFDLAADYSRKALQVAQQAGFDFLARQSQEGLDNRKLLGEQQGKMAATFAELSKSGLGITKASQVIFTPRFAPGANPQLAAALRNLERQMFPGPVSPYMVTKWSLDGQLAEMEGKDDAALESYSRAVTLLENDRRKLGDTQNNSSFLSDQIEVYYAAALQRLDRKQYSEAFQLIERSRARAVADLLASRQLTFRTPELQDLYSQSVELKAQIGKTQNTLFDAAGSPKADSDQIKSLQARVDALEGRERALEANIRQRAPKLADLSDQPPVSLEAAQAAARRGDYDVLYYLTLESGTVIWHIGANGVHVVKPYYTRHTLTGRVASIRSSLTDPNSTFDERSAVELFLVLVNPVLPFVRTHHLVIVPHEDLTNLPFQVLKNPEDGSFLGDRFQISYAPSATVLSGLGARPDFAHGRLLAVADPSITNAVAEVKAIGSLYPGRAKVVTDALASKQLLKDSLGNYNLVHLSAHGVFDANNPLLSHVKLRPSPGDDGQLTAAEMFGLNLPENSLVVLSACETGRLNATHGNEIQGIVPALLFAGASTLVLSSWKVDSASTALWMQTFYREAQTKPPSEAARIALLAVKGTSQFQHPFYWAPFLLTGQ